MGGTGPEAGGIRFGPVFPGAVGARCFKTGSRCQSAPKTVLRTGQADRTQSWGSSCLSWPRHLRVPGNQPARLAGSDGRPNDISTARLISALPESCPHCQDIYRMKNCKEKGVIPFGTTPFCVCQLGNFRVVSFQDLRLCRRSRERSQACSSQASEFRRGRERDICAGRIRREIVRTPCGWRRSWPDEGRSRC